MQPNMTSLFKVFFVLILLGSFLRDARANEIPPSKVISDFHGSLLAVMKNAKSLSAKERYKQLEPAIDLTFSFDFMIKLASGTSWKKISRQNKGNLAQAFRRMSIATYAYRFKGYSGQRFVTTGTASGVRGTQLVLTNIISPQENKRPNIVKLTYVTKKFGSSWRVIDILLNGSISELSVRHSEYRAILRGPDGASTLVKTLNKKADELISD